MLVSLVFAAVLLGSLLWRVARLRVSGIAGEA
jgi:hypothetical protein